MQKSLPVLYERKALCCGCTACFAICPQAAISMVEDNEGFEYPEINENKCIRCYLCLKVCPIKRDQNVYTRYQYKQTYAQRTED